MAHQLKDGRKKCWVGQKIIQGKKRTKTFYTKESAEEWESHQEKQRPPSLDTDSLHSWAIHYLNYAKKRFVHKTFLGKKRALKLFLNHPEVNHQMPVNALERRLTLNVLTDLDDEFGGTAANNYKKDLHAAWEWGIEFLDFPELNPFRRIPKFAPRRKPRYVPPEKDFWDVYEVATGQDRRMLITYLHTAARRGELFRLKWIDVDFSRKAIKLTSRKNKSAEWVYRWIGMSEDVISALREQKECTGKREHVFISHRTSEPFVTREKMMPQLCGKAGIETPFGLHSIRHLAASIMASLNVPLPDIQQILGHTSLTTTEIYIKSLNVQQNGATVMPSPPIKANVSANAPKRSKVVSLINYRKQG